MRFNLAQLHRGPLRQARLAVRGLAPAILAVLALAGCGSSTSARDRFVARANAICIDARKRVEHVSDAKIAKRQPIHGPEVVGKVAALLADEAEELAAVKAPAALARQYGSFIAAARQEAASVGQLAADYRMRNMRGIERDARADRALKLKQQAKALGLSGC